MVLLLTQISSNFLFGFNLLNFEINHKTNYAPIPLQQTRHKTNIDCATNPSKKNLNMKYLILLLFIGLQSNCQSQDGAKNISKFANKDFLNTTKSDAKYYRVHKLIDHVMGVNVNPNANANSGQIMPDEYGPAFTPMTSGVEHHEITFYNFKNKRVLVAGALVQGENYELYGLATWYTEYGNKSEVGFFNKGIRGNYYELYDKKGNVVDTGFYVNGEKFTDFNIDKRLIGVWQSSYNSKGYFGQDYPMKLFNRIHESGVIEIWNEAESEQSWFQDIAPNVTRLHHSFEKTGESTGILTTINYFTGQEDKESIEFIGEDKIISTITKNSDTSLIGLSYKFTKMKE